MTKNEALLKAIEGNKITHRYFSDDEYIEHADGHFRTEEGYRVTHEFWSYRTAPDWQIDWVIYK